MPAQSIEQKIFPEVFGTAQCVLLTEAIDSLLTGGLVDPSVFTSSLIDPSPLTGNLTDPSLLTDSLINPSLLNGNSILWFPL